MALPRKYQFSPGQEGFFHCYSRCVRRSFLTGCDPLTGQDFSHRRQWIVNRLSHLSKSFAIDIYAYAVMSNHWHVVLYVDSERPSQWSDEEVFRRWRSVFNWRKPNPSAKSLSIDALDKKQLAVWRERLKDISWFMKSVNEPLARIANAEDECKGHFWESRFGCTVLLDDPAVLAAMSYVDLNPIKAGLARSLRASDFTSIQKRIKDYLTGNTNKHDPQKSAQADNAIQPVFTDSEVSTKFSYVTFNEYTRLLSTTAQRETEEFRPPSTFNIEHNKACKSQWLEIVDDFEKLFSRAAGNPETLSTFVKKMNRKNVLNKTGARLLNSIFSH